MWTDIKRLKDVDLRERERGNKQLRSSQNDGNLEATSMSQQLCPILSHKLHLRDTIID